jgi:hypothetical protein
MLAKQAWRMAIDPDSLCARVLKAKYFQNSSILDAKPVTGLSYSWRSILKGVGLMKEGVIWRVGDGSCINMWTDHWLNREDAMRPITPKGNCVLTKVSELIDPTTGSWDEELVRDIFWEFDVKDILATPIKPEFEDFLARQPDSKGCFTVKSAYRMYVTRRDGSQQSSSTETGFEWKKI